MIIVKVLYPCTLAILFQFAISVEDLTSWKFHKTDKLSNSSSSPLFLSQLLEDGVRVEEIQRLARVSLFSETHESYSGYITVNKAHESNLFFWFCKSEQNSEERPLVLWLQGGPGDTFLTSFFLGNGPYCLDKNGPRLADVAWTQSYNMLYIDSPVGTGYSFSSQYKYYSKHLDDVIEKLHTALQQFFLIFPEFQPNEVYLAGESFAGKFIPPLAMFIHARNEEADKFISINLKGLFIGCGFIDPQNQFYHAENLYEFGIIDENQRERIMYLETAVRENIKNGNYYLADAILVSLAATMLGLGYWPPIDIINPQIDATEYRRIIKFVTQKEVRKQLHVGTNSFSGKTMVMWHYRKQFLKSSGSYVSEALKHYRVLLYSGQFDMLIPPIQITKVVEALQWSGLEQFNKAQRETWRVNGELAGYKKASGNLAVVEVLKANHFILHSQPQFIFELFTSFVNKTLMSKNEHIVE